MIAIHNKTLNSQVRKVYEVRRTVNLLDAVEKHLQRSRGNLMNNVAKDIDITQAINFFLGYGIRTFNIEMKKNTKLAPDALNFLEKILSEPTLDSNERMFDLIDTLRLQDHGNSVIGKKKVVTPETK